MLVDRNLELQAEYQRLCPGGSYYGFHAWYAERVRECRDDMGWGRWALLSKGAQHAVLRRYLASLSPAPMAPIEVGRAA